MGLGYRYTKYILLAILAIATLVLSLSIQEFGIYFGILLLVGVALTSIYLFMHFDENINEKLIIELAIDGFAGLIIFTYPEPNARFFMLDFSFWLAVLGMLHVVSGLFDHRKSNLLWLYIISGIMMIVFGFIILNYSTEYLGSIVYLIGIVLAYYAILNIYLINKNKA
ncbi:MAG: DUF308 domain-containing protein [Bacteroidota bacterium]